MLKKIKFFTVYYFGIVFLSLFPTRQGQAYVLLSSKKATLPVNPTNATITFDWDGKSPTIKDKEKFSDGIYANLDDTAFMEQLLTIALNTWSAVPAAYIKLAFRRSEQPIDLDQEDRKFAIVTDKSDNLSTAAFAKPFVDPDDPSNIVDCDISIADTETTAQSLAYTIIHEVGHCLGLGHSHTNYNAIMGYSRTQTGYLKLGADDMAGLIFLYPDPSYVTGEPKDIVCGTIAHRPHTPWQSLFLLILGVGPLTAAVVLGRRGTRRT